MKYFYFLLVLVFCFCCFPISTTFAIDETNYARITGENTFLYTNNENETENIFFKLPTSYFVELVEENEDFCYVKFQNFFGYVKTDNLTKVYETPQNPFPTNITFQVNKSASVAILSTPSTSGTLIGFIPSGQTANYVGQTNGDEAIAGLGNLWFFATFKTDDYELCGYVYAPLCENLKPIPQNTENLSTTPPSPPTFFVSENITQLSNLWLVLILFIIAVLLFCLTFLPFVSTRKKQV